MASVSYEEIIAKICREKGVTTEAVEAKIKEKLQQLSDLISKQGAAHIVANEYGVKVYESQGPKRLTIKDLDPQLRNVEAVVKVQRIFEIRSFQTATRKGRVANLQVADSSGSCRLVLWDEKQLKEIEEKKIKEGDILKIMNGYVRNNNYSGLELHLGGNGSWLVNPEGEKLDNVVAATGSAGSSEGPEKRAIKDVKENEQVLLVGTLVQIFEPRFYDSCPQCRKKVVFGEDEGFHCAAHGKVDSIPQAILNFVFD